jgi:mono/diheme cytochrome c family protein
MRSSRRVALVIAIAIAGCSDTVGPERPIDGQQLYENYCARCHGVDGRPVPEQPQARDLSNRRIVDNLSDEAISMMIRRGKPPAMPAFRDEFTDAALMVLVAYVRSLSGSRGSKAKPADDGADAQ